MEEGEIRKNAECYLGYLEKEMTIMGILSAFCIAAPSLLLEQLAQAQHGFLSLLWCTGKNYFLLGSLLSVLSAAWFYKERSLLAFYYGRISIAIANCDEKDIKLKLHHSDDWVTWLPYQIAFWIGVTAVLEFVLGYLQHCVNCPTSLRSLSQWWIIKWMILFLVVMIVLIMDRLPLWKGNAWIDSPLFKIKLIRNKIRTWRMTRRITK